MKKKIIDIINKKNKSKIISLTAYSKNIATILENAQLNYKEGSKEFKTLIGSTERPAKILTKLVEAQGSSDTKVKANALLKARLAIDEELSNRLQGLTRKKAGV